MKSINNKFLFLFSVVSFSMMVLLNSCKPKCERNPNDPECLGEEEVITTLKITFKDSASGNILYNYQFKDSDNNGIPEVFDTIKLAANKTYKAELQFLNEATLPTQDVTNEIEAEKNDHLLVFETTAADINVGYIDYDNNNLPVGLQTYWTTHAAANGHILVTLRHQPGVKDGTKTPGDTDMQVDFPVVVE